MDKKEKIFDVGKYISDELENLEIPEGISPENMKAKLEKVNKTKNVSFKRWATPLATAACMVILVGAGIYTQNLSNRIVAHNDIATVTETIAPLKTTEEPVVTENSDVDPNPAAIYKASKDFYDKVYDLIDGNREVGNEYYTYSGLGVIEDVAESMSDEALTGSVSSNQNTSVQTSTNTNKTSSRGESESYSKDYAQTNVQVEFVDEGDIVKNDGRYLYQLIDDGSQQIQIIDTLNGLKQVACISGFSEISEFYVSGDMLVVVEDLWAVDDSVARSKSATTEVYYISDYNNTTRFCYVHFYDISDRVKPREIKKYTIKGAYKTSRISDGFLYFLCGYTTEEPESREDISAYIPVVDGAYLGADSIYLPEESDAVNYLTMVSVDLAEPTTLSDTMAVISSGNNYYVSESNIYVLDSIDGQLDEGIVCDETRVIKFSYNKGDIEPAAEGSVKGNVLDQFAMDEHEGYFRMITTVNPYEAEAVTNSIDGSFLGYNIKKWLPKSNSVYVLDDKLNITGKIENLAEDELVYSARFMGDTGYFVTFRQTDPLFSVDFSNPYKPKILGELKISGFSEYLHFYSDDLLLGIGYEADEKTGRTEGVKLSMFDVSDPKDVKEIHKLVLDYDHSDAFYNHNAVLVSPGKNLIGFISEEYTYDYLREYGVYSYDPEKGFVQKYKFDCTPDGYHYEARGTYIGDTFYLLKQTYGVGAYDINTGELLDELSMAEILAE